MRNEPMTETTLDERGAQVSEGVRRMEETVVFLFKALVDDEDQVAVTTLRGQHNVIFEVDVHVRDVAFALGRDSANVDAVRRILNALSKKYRVKYTLDVLQK